MSFIKSSNVDLKYLINFNVIVHPNSLNRDQAVKRKS